MKPVRLASKPQASSRAGPFLGPRATGVPESKKKCYHAIRDGFPQFLREHLFSRSDPHVVGNGDFLGFRPVLGRGYLEKFRARAENRKMQFPGARALLGKKICPPQNLLPKSAQLFYILRFGQPDPHGREIPKLGFSGLGQPLGT